VRYRYLRATNKILELVLVKDLNPGVWKAHAAGQAIDDLHGGAPLVRLQSTPENGTNDHAQRAGGRVPPAAAKTPAPTGINSRQLFTDSDDELTVRESPDTTPTSYGTSDLHTATRERAKVWPHRARWHHHHRSNPKAQNMFAMWDGGDDVSAKTYSQSKHSLGRDPKGTQIPSLRDIVS
jgi:hypothetical protein